jgi:hypothetical protein
MRQLSMLAARKGHEERAAIIMAASLSSSGYFEMK